MRFSSRRPTPHSGLSASSLALGALLVAAAAVLLLVAGSHEPVGRWLIWRFAAYAVLTVGWSAGCFALGHRLLRALGAVHAPPAEHTALALALGVLGFFFLWFGIGIVGWYGPATFVLAPLACFLVGGRPALRYVRLLRRAWQRPARRRARPGALSIALCVGAVLSVFVLYAACWTPFNIGYDSRWYHLGMAQHYAAAGGIERFDNGWFLGAYPQLASVLYAWAFCVPFGTVADKALLAVHVELALFLASVAAVPALCRRLLRGRRLPLAWVTVFAFPSVFLYNINGGADHVAGFFAVPLTLAWLRALPRLDLRPCVLLTALAVGPLLTKYTALGLVLVPAVTVLLRAAWLLLRAAAPGERGRVSRSLGACIVVALTLTAPHWLKNSVYYHNPVYPLLGNWFGGTPWVAEMAERLKVYTPATWSAPHSLRGVLQGLTELVMFSFRAHDFRPIHLGVPVFGSLFTLTLPALLFLKRPGRVWLVVLSVHVGVFFWWWTYHQDRYLQAWIPVMAACTAVALNVAWRLGIGSRVGASVLCAVQFFWAVDVPFHASHGAYERSGLSAAIEQASATLRGEQHPLRAGFKDIGALGRALAKFDAPAPRLLLHDFHMQLGIDAPVVADAAAWQGGLSYVSDPAPADVHEKLRKLGVTHVAWSQGASKGWDSLGGDVTFLYYARNFLQTERSTRKVEGWFLAPLPEHAPAVPILGKTLVFTCPGSYEPGVYVTQDLSVVPLSNGRPSRRYPKPTVRVDVKAAGEWLDKVDAVVVEPACAKELPSLKRKRFRKTQKRGNWDIWIYRSSRDRRRR